MRRRVVLLACVAPLLLAAPAAVECLKANTDGQVAQGQLTIGRAKDAAGRLERPYILQLAAPACMEGSEPDDNVKSTMTIHVSASNDRMLARFRPLVGKRVEVRGNPFPAHTSHHHAPIVMLVEAIVAR